MAEIFLFRLVCVTTIGVCVFRCVASVAHLFYMLMGGFMSKNIPKRVIDITGMELTPREPAVCLGNRDQMFACCCDECDYFLLCFPELDLKIKLVSDDRIKRTRNFNNSSSFFLKQTLYC